MKRGSNLNNPGLISSPNYGKEPKWEKIKRKVNGILVSKIADTPLQFKVYSSYWHYKLLNNVNISADKFNKKEHYLTQKPNYGAGIGHQLANWNTGLFFADYFNLKYAHSPFSTEKWEAFFGFGEGEVKAAELREQNFKIVKLPRFDSNKQDEVDLVKSIINSYKGGKILFCMETDQGYMRQFDTSKILSNKFFKAKSRVNDKLIYSQNNLNIAVHIRRRMAIETDVVWQERGLNNEYFATALTNVLETIKEKEIAIYLFSQGNIEDFPEFVNFKDVKYCIDMGPVDSVLHMINADILISSKSSFSYKPALITKGINICPKSFWHGYPEADNYILADNDGNFDKNKLLKALG